MGDNEVRVFGGPSVLADGREYSCYTVEWTGKEPPREFVLGGVRYVIEDECRPKTLFDFMGGD